MIGACNVGRVQRLDVLNRRGKRRQIVPAFAAQCRWIAQQREEFGGARQVVEVGAGNHKDEDLYRKTQSQCSEATDETLTELL